MTMTDDEIRIQHIFRDPVSGLQDAIVLPLADYEALDVAAIEALKAERVEAHRALLAEVAARPVPSEEEVAEAKALELVELEARVEVLRAEVDSVLVAEVKADAEVLDAEVDVKRVR